MHFDFADHQEMLKATIDRFGEDHYGLSKRIRYQQTPSGFSEQNWKILSELGLVGLPFAEQYGGLDASASDLIAAFEGLGRRLVLEPISDCSILAGGVLQAGAHNAAQQQLCQDAAAGEKRVVLAHYEHAGRGSIAWCQARAERLHNGGYRLNGVKSAVPYGAGADAFLVTAHTPGEVAGAPGMGVYVVKSDQTGLTAKIWRMVDGAPCAELTFNNVEISADAKLKGDGGLLMRPMARYFLSTSAEALGLMETMLAATLEHLRNRRQFGAPLSSFQALQHRMAAQYAALEQCRSLIYWAAAADTDDMQTFAHRIAGARAFVAEASVTLGHEAIQMHGGMGVTDELLVSHAHRRAFVLSRFPSDANTALDAFCLGAKHNCRAA
ncbi:MAG: acyl-CoA dehydrogenase [Caulobacterales bacterium]